MSSLAEPIQPPRAPSSALPAPTRGRILHATGALLVAGVLVKCAAVGKEVVVAAAYGRSDAMDAFLAAILIPNLLINVVGESMSQALLPVLVRMRLSNGPHLARRLFTNALAAAFLILSGAAILLALAAPLLLPLLASHFSSSKLDLTVHLCYLVLPCVVLGGIASLFTTALNAAGSFSPPALAPILVTVAVVACTAAFHSSLGIWALAFGTLAGMFAQMMVLAAATHRLAFPLRLQWHRSDADTREVAARFWPLLLGALVASGGLLVDQAMAAALPSGSLSALAFAGRFVSVILALLAGSLSTALGPAFSALVARSDWHGCRAAVRAWTLRSAAISVPIFVALILAAPYLVRLTLQHGAFGAKDSHAVIPVLVVSAIQIPFFVVSRVHYRMLLALGRNQVILYCGTINLILDIVVNLILMRIMGVAGIALATSLWTVATFLFLRYWARKFLASPSPTASRVA